jgi:hypothetical protein
MTKPLYFYNGTTFELVGPTTPQSPIAYQTSAPTAPATGDLWIDSDGDVDTYNRQLTRYYFVATAAQTTITGTDANGLTLAYVAGSEAVYVNGALQVRGQDYTATNGTSVVMTAALAVNDVVEIFAYTAFTVANAYTKSETDGIAAAAAGLRMVVPTSVAVGSGTGSVDAIGNVTFSGATSISINGCFNSTYDNYKVILSISSVSGTNPYIHFRMRTSGTDNSSSIYTWNESTSNSNSTSIVTDYSNGGTAQWLLAKANTGNMSNKIIEISNPFLTQVSAFSCLSQSYNVVASNSSNSLIQGTTTATTSFDGTSFYVTSGNLTGTLRIYGYKD